MHVWAGLAHSPGECGPGDVMHVVWIESSGGSVLSKTFTDLSVHSIINSCGGASCVAHNMSTGQQRSRSFCGVGGREDGVLCGVGGAGEVAGVVASIHGSERFTCA